MKQIFGVGHKIQYKHPLESFSGHGYLCKGIMIKGPYRDISLSFISGRVVDRLSLVVFHLQNMLPSTGEDHHVAG